MIRPVEPEPIRLSGSPASAELPAGWPPPWVDVGLTIEPPPEDQTIRVGHGLVYVHRDGRGFTVLDRGNYRETAYPRLPQPERDIARALLVHALRELDAMDEADGGQGTVRGGPRHEKHLGFNGERPPAGSQHNPTSTRGRRFGPVNA